MKLARLALLALAVAAPLMAIGPAHAGTPQDYTVTDEAGDAPAAVDIVKVRVRPTANGYQGNVFFSDLRAQKPNRWLISFAKSNTAQSARGNPTKTGNVVEFRINPAGKMSTKAFDYYANDTFKPSTCAGVTATPNFNTDKIKFVVPTACWNIVGTYAIVTAASRHYAPTEPWTTDPYDVGNGSKSDLVQLGWNFG